MEVAAAGGHNIILIGPPEVENNAGKTSAEYFTFNHQRSIRNHQIHSGSRENGEKFFVDDGSPV